MSNRQQSLDLLNQTHAFPAAVMVKVIGRNDEFFIEQILCVVRRTTGLDSDPPYSLRTTPGARHVALTLEPCLADAEQVLAVYESLRLVDGVVMLL